MGLSLDRVIAMKSVLVQRLDGMFATLIKEHRTQEWLLERRREEIFDAPDYQRLPKWAQEQIRGYYFGKADMVNRYMTVFAYLYKGQLYRTTLDKHSPWPTWEESPVGNQICNRYEASGFWWPDGKMYFATTRTDA